MCSEMRLETGTHPSRGNYVAMRDLEIAALMAEAAANNDEVEGVLLNLAGMIRALKIMADDPAPFLPRVRLGGGIRQCSVCRPGQFRDKVGSVGHL